MLSVKTPPQARRRTAWGIASTLAVLACAASPAVAGTLKPALATTSAAIASTSLGTTCEGQVFTQSFLAYGDTRFYTPLAGGEFNAAPEGWALSGGASIVSAVRPDGSSGGVLDLPAGAKAVSAPMCVTLVYPSARAWVNGSSGSKGIAVSVSYNGTASAISPQEVGVITSPHGSWTLGEFKVEPALAGREEAPREVRFVFEGKKGDTRLSGVYVDPRMTK